MRNLCNYAKLIYKPQFTLTDDCYNIYINRRFNTSYKKCCYLRTVEIQDKYYSINYLTNVVIIGRRSNNAYIIGII